MRIVIFGANGGSGRQLTTQALAAGHQVVTVTRNPGSFPIAARRLEVAAADVHDRAATRPTPTRAAYEASPRGQPRCCAASGRATVPAPPLNRHLSGAR